MAPVKWQPETPAETAPWPVPPLKTAIMRGLLGHCPACGKSHLFNGFLKVVKECRNCHAPLGLARADDAPPYLTIFVTGHIIIPLLYAVDKAYEPSTFAMSAIFVPLSLVLALGMLRPIKGGTVGVMLTLNMLREDANRI